MTGPVDATKSKPLDEAGCKHHLLLLKSMHCAREVIYEGKHAFIKCLTFNHEGSDISCVVYLAGKTGSFDAAEIQIKHDIPVPAEEAHHE